MFGRGKTCCFTGKRPQSLPFGYNEEHKDCKRIKAQLKKKIEQAIKSGYIHFISGMALGPDTWAAEAVIALKKKHCHITFEAAIPHENQAIYWSVDQRERYYKILSQCDKETLISRMYTESCHHKRNRYMVDNSSLLIAVYDGKSMGGTGFTVEYARGRGLEVCLVWVEKG